MNRFIASLAWNNDRGMTTNRCYEIVVSAYTQPFSEVEVRMSSVDGVKCRLYLDRKCFTVAGERFHFERYRPWIGSMVSDGVILDLATTRRLLERALMDGGFSLDEWSTEGPFVDLMEKHNAL